MHKNWLQKLMKNCLFQTANLWVILWNNAFLWPVIGVLCHFIQDTFSPLTALALCAISYVSAFSHFSFWM